MKSPPAVMP